MKSFATISKSSLRLVLGDVSVTGFPGPGKLNLESLSDQDVGYGMLDALTYSGDAEGGPLLVVTTRPLLNKWLAARSREKLPELNVSADLETALGQDNFFTFAIGDDAAFYAKRQSRTDRRRPASS